MPQKLMHSAIFSKKFLTHNLGVLIEYKVFSQVKQYQKLLVFIQFCYSYSIFLGRRTVVSLAWKNDNFLLVFSIKIHNFCKPYFSQLFIL